MSDTQIQGSTTVLVSFVQDRSGSMGSVWDETLNGFRSFVKELKEKGPKDGVTYLFSLTTFDTMVETPLVAVPIEQVDENELSKHGPRGSTALLDAVGKTIEDTDKLRQGPQKVIVVIVTDGQENSSREWTKDTLHKVIDAKLTAGNWTFTYLGTQPETWDDAGHLGVGAGSTATYIPTMAPAAYAATANAVHCLSKSTHSGTRSLMADYIPDDVAATAGMRVGTHTGGPPQPQAIPPQPQQAPPPPCPTPRTRPSGRWR